MLTRKSLNRMYIYYRSQKNSSIWFYFFILKDFSNELSLRIVKIERSLYFVNIESFKKSIYELIGGAKQRSNSSVQILVEDKSPRYLLLDFSAVNYIDSTSVNVLLEIIEDLRKQNVYVYICQCQGKQENPKNLKN